MSKTNFKPDFSKPAGPLLGLLYFLLLFVVVFYVVIITTGVLPRFGVNKTIGWAWDICNWMPFFALVCLVMYILGYLVLLFCKATINKTLSILNLFLVILSSAISLFPAYSFIYMILLLVPVLSVLTLFINIGYAIAKAVAKRNAIG